MILYRELRVVTLSPEFPREFILNPVIRSFKEHQNVQVNYFQDPIGGPCFIVFDFSRLHDFSQEQIFRENLAAER